MDDDMVSVAAVERMMRPRSVAVVGASEDANSIGGMVLDNLLRGKFPGDLHLVSRSQSEIRGVPCVRTIGDLPLGIDTVALVVPAAALPDAVAACARRQAGAAIAFASGFAEAGAAGREQQDRMVAAARSGGMVMCGPNCVGFSNFVDGVALAFDAFYRPPPVTGPRPGKGVGVIAQSGAISLSIQAGLIARGLVLTYAVSSGNEAVLSAEDYLAFMIAEGHTGVVVVFLEQIRHPRRFRALAVQARERGCTIVLMHPGRTARAQQAALSHTGALAGNYAAMQAVLAHEGVIITRNLDELFDVAALLAACPTLPTDGPAVISNSGAYCGVALDLASDVGLDLPELSAATVAALREIYPAQERFANPFDTSTVAFGRRTIFGEVTKIMLDDPGVGGVILAVVPGPPALQMAKSDHVLPAALQSDKPVVLVMLGDASPLTQAFTDAMRGSGVPLFRSPDRAIRAMALLVAHARAVQNCRARGSTAVSASVAAERVAPLPEYRGKARLEAAGITVPAGRLAHSVDEAVEIAEHIGFPVVLKAQSSTLMHKTEHGGVLLNLADAGSVRSGWGRVISAVRAAQPDLELDGLLVERMVPEGMELIVAARRDPHWGPVIVAGLGGIWTEALDDVRLMPAGLSEPVILAELRRLKGVQLLDGMRGRPAVDQVAVAGVIAALGRMMAADPRVMEIEINPLVATSAQGACALDALIVVADTSGPGGCHV